MASPCSRAPLFAAQVFGVAALTLMLVWLLRFQGGIDFSSHDTKLIFNVHPFLMFLGLIFIGGQAMMTYRMVRAKKEVQKLAHLLLHLISISLGIVGIVAVFKFHNKNGIANMYSLHSWMGISVFCLYGLQWLFGFLFFWLPHPTEQTRKKVHPLHRTAGVLIFIMAICTAISGLIEKFLFLQLQKRPKDPEPRLINFTGLLIILYGLAVCASVIW